MSGDRPLPVTRRHFLLGATVLAVGGVGAVGLPGAFAAGSSGSSNWLRVSILRTRVGEPFHAVDMYGRRTTLRLTSVTALPVFVDGADPDRQMALDFSSEDATSLAHGLVTISASGLEPVDLFVTSDDSGGHYIIVHGGDRP